MRRIVGTEVFPGLYFGGLFCVCVPLAIMTFRYNPHQHYPSSTGKPRILYGIILFTQYGLILIMFSGMMLFVLYGIIVRILD